eukprot:Tbor_TRINITY_DN4681_c0_g1::TRINITY_DN4681_c0_g1_i1::g.15006::m.15006
MSINTHQRFATSEKNNEILTRSVSVYPTQGKLDTVENILYHTHISATTPTEDRWKSSSVRLFEIGGEIDYYYPTVDDERHTILSTDSREKRDTTFVTFFNMVSDGVGPDGNEHITIESFRKFLTVMQLDINDEMIQELFATISRNTRAYKWDVSHSQEDENRNMSKYEDFGVEKSNELKVPPSADTMTMHQAYTVFRLGMSGSWIEKILSRCDIIGSAAEAMVERQGLVDEIRKKLILLEELRQRSAQEREAARVKPQGELAEDKASAEGQVQEVSAKTAPKSEEEISLETVEGIQQKKLQELTKQRDKIKQNIHFTTEKLKAVKEVCMQKEEEVRVKDYELNEADQKLHSYSQYFASVESEFNEVKKRYEDAKVRQKLFSDEQIAAKEANEKVRALLEDSRNIEKSLEVNLTNMNYEMNNRLEPDMTTTDKLLVEVRNALKSYRKGETNPVGEIVVFTETENMTVECQSDLLQLENRDAQLKQLIDSYNEWLHRKESETDSTLLNNLISYSNPRRPRGKQQEDHFIISELALYLDRCLRKNEKN